MKLAFGKFIAMVARKAAYAAHGAASEWLVYQPKEPACLRVNKK